LLPLVLSGNGDPLEVLHGLANGVDFFECEFPFRLAQNGLAWHYTAPPSAEELRV
jgi:queuine/archaeosine tRNA-ribosyltransferase